MKLKKWFVMILCLCLLGGMHAGAEEENDSLILNFGGKEEADYRLMGEMETPEGYGRKLYKIHEDGDPNEHRFHYIAQEENRAVQSAYVSGVARKTGAQMLDTLRHFGVYYPLAEDRALEIAGHPVRYMITIGNPTSERTQVDSLMIFLYVDVLEDSAVSFSFESIHGSFEELPTEAEMLKDVEAVGNDLKFGFPSSSQFGSPSILVSSLAVAGK